MLVSMVLIMSSHELRAGIVVVPHLKKDLGKGLIKAIRKQAGI